MARTETVAETYDCDHPKCNKAHTVPEGTRPPGIELTVKISYDTGGDVADVYACSRTHVGPAVLAVMDAQTTQAEPTDEPEAEEPETEDPSAASPNGTLAGSR